MSPSAEPVIAAGAVLWRPAGRADGQGADDTSAIEVAVVHRPKYDDWSLPKGKSSPGEHVLVTAVREVTEETGFRVRLGRRLPSSHYTANGRPKAVHYWAAEATDGDFSPNDEVDDLAWLPPALALQRLTWERDSSPVEALAAGPVRTTPLVLLRHASSVKRGDWDGNDASRPLNDDGRQEATDVVEVLRCYGIARVLASDTERALATVRPLAEALDVPIEVEPLFSDTNFADRPDAALDRARDLLRVQFPTVLCTHRPVLPWLLSTLLEPTAVDVPADPVRPGGFVTLHVAGGTPVGAEVHTL